MEVKHQVVTLRSLSGHLSQVVTLGVFQRSKQSNINTKGNRTLYQTNVPKNPCCDLGRNKPHSSGSLNSEAGGAARAAVSK